MIDATFLYNPAAGRSPLSPGRLSPLLEKLQANGIRCEPVITHPGVGYEPGLDLCNKQLLIVYGGDGTVHQAIQLLAAHPVRLALMPAGTANVLARELHIPLDLDKALEVIIRGNTRKIYLGQSGGRLFHLMTGVGLDAHIIMSVPDGLKKLLGVGAFWVAGIVAFATYRLREFEIEADGERYAGTFLVIANARNYGGSLLMAPEADLSDESLDVCIFTGRRKSAFIRYLLGVLRGKHTQYRDVIYRKAGRVEVRGPALPVQMDGEVVGRLPISVTLFRPGIEVIVP